MIRGSEGIPTWTVHQGGGSGEPPVIEQVAHELGEMLGHAVLDAEQPGLEAGGHSPLQEAAGVVGLRLGARGRLELREGLQLTVIPDLNIEVWMKCGCRCGAGRL